MIGSGSSKVSAQAAGATSGERAPQRQYLIRLYQILDTRFSDDELKTLCFHLDGVDYDQLRGDKARELVSYLERHERIPELVKLGKELRDDIHWEDTPPEQLLARLKHARRSPEGTPSAPAGTFTQEKTQATVDTVYEQSTAGADPTALHAWLSQLKQVRRRLAKLKTWITRYNNASEVAQESIRVQSWLSSIPLREEGRNWQALAQLIYINLSNIQRGYGHCAVDIKDTSGFTAKEYEIQDALGRFKTEIDNIENSLSVLRESQEDTECRKEFKQIQKNAMKMARCSVELCQHLYYAIGELVDQLGKPIKERLEGRRT